MPRNWDLAITGIGILQILKNLKTFITMYMFLFQYVDQLDCKVKLHGLPVVAHNVRCFGVSFCIVNC